jgi:hypothetical protein
MGVVDVVAAIAAVAMAAAVVSVVRPDRSGRRGVRHLVGPAPLIPRGPLIDDLPGRPAPDHPSPVWPEQWWIADRHGSGPAVWTEDATGPRVVWLRSECPGPLWRSLAATLPDRGQCSRCTAVPCRLHDATGQTGRRVDQSRPVDGIGSDVVASLAASFVAEVEPGLLRATRPGRSEVTPS